MAFGDDTSRRRGSVLPYRFTLWAIVFLTGLLVYLDGHPWVIENEFPRSEGVELTREADSDVILVLDWKAISESPDRFSERDFSAAWINLFEQELGPVTIATPSSLTGAHLEKARTIVLTSSVSHSVPETLVKRLRDWVLDGNLMLVERPGGPLREAFSANGRVGTQQAQQITYARGLDEEFFSQMEEMPLSTQYVGSTTARDGAVTLMSIDGAPVVYAVPIGDGHVVTLEFDVGEQLVALQQGKPTEDFRVAPTDGDTPRTSDLVLDDELRSTGVPHADLLERFLFWGVVQHYSPTPAFWLFPAGAEGAVVALHEDWRLGDGGGWMLDYELGRRGVSTLFTTVDSGLSAAGAAVIDRQGGEIGLLWRLQATPGQTLRPLGVADVEPVARPLGLEEQLDRLGEKLPSGRIRSARIFESYWTDDWTSPLSALAAEGVRIDASYVSGADAGYGFGTGLPFLALDADGLPLSIRELPVVVPDDPGRVPDVSDFLAASRDGHHQAIPVSINPATFAEYPDMERFEAWLALFDVAETTGHIVTSALRYDAFLRARRKGGIRTRLVDDQPVPTIRDVPREPPPEDEETDETRETVESSTGERALLMRVTVEAKWRSMVLAVPNSIAGRRFLTAREKASRVGEDLVSGELETDVTNYVGYAVRRIPLKRGFNTVDVYYR